MQVCRVLERGDRPDIIENMHGDMGAEGTEPLKRSLARRVLPLVPVLVCSSNAVSTARD